MKIVTRFVNHLDSKMDEYGIEYVGVYFHKVDLEENKIVKECYPPMWNSVCMGSMLEVGVPYNSRIYILCGAGLPDDEEEEENPPVRQLDGRHCYLGSSFLDLNGKLKMWKHGPLIPDGISACLEGRLLDLDANVRAEAVAVVCDLGKFSLIDFPDALIARAIDRLRDKMTSVRKEALRKLLEVYREYCTKCYDGQMPLGGCFEQIPCKILGLSLDKTVKEFRPQKLELLLAADLFPASLPGQERMRHWIYLYSIFTPAHVKALNLILSQKRRFQLEMRGYLSLHIKEKGIDPEEVNVRTKNAFTQMSSTFLNPTKVEECFCKLNQLKDNSILFPLMQLLDEPVLSNAKIKRDKFLKDIGVKNSLFEFLELLSLKCSNNIFSSEHVRHILDHVSGSRCRGNHVGDSSWNLLSDVVRSFPLLLRDSEDHLKRLILKEDSAVGEKLLLILAKVGPSISMDLSPIYPLLEKLCLEGTRAQSKAAISVIALSPACFEESVLVCLCQKLIESLRQGWKIPTVLQSLGCILQHSVLAFQQHIEEVSSFIRKQIFDDKTAEDSDVMDEDSQTNVSWNCKLKVYGLKTLVRSVLPKKGTQGGEHISDLLNLLSKVLIVGAFCDGTSACESDIAHMRLAAAKSVLRLSRRWDMHLSPQIFHSTVMMAKDASPLIRKVFLDKTYKLLIKHVASRKFACAFAFAASDCVKDLQDASFGYLVNFVKEYGRATKGCLTPNKEDSLTDCPEYIVVYMLHALAHDVEFPSLDSHDEEQFAQFCRPLLQLLHVLVNSQFADGNSSVVKKTLLHLRSIFRAIRRAEDAVDPEKSLKLHVLADIGDLSLNLLQPDGTDSSLGLGLVLLPSSLYTTSKTRIHNEESVSQGRYVNDEFVGKLVQIFEHGSSQVANSTAKRGPNFSKGRAQRQNVLNSSGSKQADKLRDLTTQEKIISKKISRTRILEPCPKVKKQKNVDVPPVPKECNTDASQKLEDLNIESRSCSKSSNLELFGMESDISTQDFDVLLSVSHDESTRKSRDKSAKTSQLSKEKFNHGCSSDGSTVSFLGLRDARKQRVQDGAEAIASDSGEGIARTQGPGNRKRDILVDRTNSLAVTGLPKSYKPKRSHEGDKIQLESSPSDLSNENKDAIAYRTRRRRV